MKKKLILGSSIAAMTLAVVSLTSCGGNGNIVTPEVLDTTLVENSSTNSKYYSSLMVSNNQTKSGGYLVLTDENKIINTVTGKSITIDNLSDYSVTSVSLYYNYGYSYLLRLSKENSGIYHVICLDNTMEKVVEIDATSSSLGFYRQSSSYEIKNGKPYYCAIFRYDYYDSNNDYQEKTFEIEVDSETSEVKVVNTSTSASKDFDKRNYSELTTGYYYTVDSVEDNYLYKLYDSSYGLLGEFETNIYDFSLVEVFNDKIYLQGGIEVPETYKNALTYYNGNMHRYGYIELKTYCVDIANKKIKEIDTEVFFKNTCYGNKDSEYLVANYYEIKDNFINISEDNLYTGFFKDGELEYKLPVTINSMKTDIKKIDDNYLIDDGNGAYLFDKDLKLVNSVANLNDYGIYSDNYNFKKNYYDATGKLIYSTENEVDESELDDYGYVTEYNSDGDVSKILVFKDGKLETINKTENIYINYGFIITKDTTNTDKYTIKQVGGTASVTVYSSGDLYLSVAGDNCYYLAGGTVYSDAEKTKTVQYMYCLK